MSITKINKTKNGYILTRYHRRVPFFFLLLLSTITCHWYQNQLFRFDYKSIGLKYLLSVSGNVFFLDFSFSFELLFAYSNVNASKQERFCILVLCTQYYKTIAFKAHHISIIQCLYISSNSQIRGKMKIRFLFDIQSMCAIPIFLCVCSI